MAASSVVYIAPSCPAGGQFYACNSSTSRFVGCCNSNACVTGCDTKDLRPTSFNATTYSSFPNQQCDATSQSQFYVCPNTNPPFLGCCKSNPCSAASNGCPNGDLAAVVLDQGVNGSLFLDAVSDFVAEMPLVGSSVASAAAGSATSPQTSISVITIIPGPVTSMLAMSSAIPSLTPSTPSTTSAPLTLSPTPTTSIAAATNGTTTASKSKISKGAIAGTTIASLVLVSGLAAILFFVLRRKNMMNRRSQRFSRATFRQPSLFLPASQGSDAITVLAGPLGGGDDYTPPSSRGAGGSSGFSTPTKGRIAPPNASVKGMSTIRNIPPMTTVNVEEVDDEDFGPPPPIQPRSSRRPNLSPDLQSTRYYSPSSSPTPRPTNNINNPVTSLAVSTPPSGPLPPPPTLQIRNQDPSPISARNTTMTASSSVYDASRSSNVNSNYLSVPFPMPPSRTSANSISQQYPFSPQFIANNPIFGSGPSAAGPNFGFPIILAGSPSPSPPPPMSTQPQIQSHRFSGTSQNMQFQGGLLSTSPPLASSPPLVFAQPPSPQQSTVRTVRNSGHLSEGYTIRAVSLDPVPEEPGSAGNAAAPTISPSRNSRLSTGLGLSGLRTSPGPPSTMQQRRMSPLSNVQYPPRSPPENNVPGAGRGYGLGVGGMPSAGPSDNGENRRSRHVPLINYAGYNNGAGSGDYTDDYRGYRDYNRPY